MLNYTGQDMALGILEHLLQYYSNNHPRQKVSIQRLIQVRRAIQSPTVQKFGDSKDLLGCRTEGALRFNQARFDGDLHSVGRLLGRASTRSSNKIWATEMKGQDYESPYVFAQTPAVHLHNIFFYFALPF